MGVVVKRLYSYVDGFTDRICGDIEIAGELVSGADIEQIKDSIKKNNNSYSLDAKYNNKTGLPLSITPRLDTHFVEFDSLKSDEQAINYGEYLVSMTKKLQLVFNRFTRV